VEARAIWYIVHRNAYICTTSKVSSLSPKRLRWLFFKKITTWLKGKDQSCRFLTYLEGSDTQESGRSAAASFAWLVYSRKGAPRCPVVRSSIAKLPQRHDPPYSPSPQRMQERKKTIIEQDRKRGLMLSDTGRGERNDLRGNESY